MRFKCELYFTYFEAHGRSPVSIHLLSVCKSLNLELAYVDSSITMNMESAVTFFPQSVHDDAEGLKQLCFMIRGLDKNSYHCDGLHKLYKWQELYSTVPPAMHKNRTLHEVFPCHNQFLPIFLFGKIKGIFREKMMYKNIVVIPILNLVWERMN